MKRTILEVAREALLEVAREALLEVAHEARDRILEVAPVKRAFAFSKSRSWRCHDQGAQWRT